MKYQVLFFSSFENVVNTLNMKLGDPVHRNKDT